FDALDPSVDLVTVSMGGNDLDFAGVVEHCATHAYCYDDTYFTTSAGAGVSLADWSAIRLALLSFELEGIYEGIRDRVSPHAQVVATTYPRLMNKGVSSNDLCVAVGLDETDWLWAQIDTFADIVAYRAGRNGVIVADVRDAFQDNL